MDWLVWTASAAIFMGIAIMAFRDERLSPDMRFIAAAFWPSAAGVLALRTLVGPGVLQNYHLVVLAVLVGLLVITLGRPSTLFVSDDGVADTPPLRRAPSPRAARVLVAGWVFLCGILWSQTWH